MKVVVAWTCHGDMYTPRPRLLLSVYISGRSSCEPTFGSLAHIQRDCIQLSIVNRIPDSTSHTVASGGDVASLNTSALNLDACSVTILMGSYDTFTRPYLVFVRQSIEEQSAILRPVLHQERYSKSFFPASARLGFSQSALPWVLSRRPGLLVSSLPKLLQQPQLIEDSGIVWQNAKNCSGLFDNM